jgi:hypothetical protein
MKSATLSPNPEKRRFEARTFAAGTSPRTGKTLAVAEDEPAIQATARSNHDFFPVRLDASLNVNEMRVDFPLSDTQIPGQVLCAQLICFHERHHFLTQGFHRHISKSPR